MSPPRAATSPPAAGPLPGSAPKPHFPGPALRRPRGASPLEPTHPPPRSNPQTAPRLWREPTGPGVSPVPLRALKWGMGQGVPRTQRKGPLVARESPLREAAHYTREQSSHRGRHELLRLGAWSPEAQNSLFLSAGARMWGTHERPEPHPATCGSSSGRAPQLGASTGRVCGLQLSARAPEPPRPRRLPQRSPPVVPAGPRRHRPPVGSASSGARRCPAAQHTAGSGWTAPLWVDGVPVDIGQMRACLGPPAPSAQGSLWQQLRDPALPPRASFLDWAVSTRIAVGWSQRLRPPLPGQGLCSLTREGSPNSGQGPEACWTTL